MERAGDQEPTEEIRAIQDTNTGRRRLKVHAVHQRDTHKENGKTAQGGSGHGESELMINKVDEPYIFSTKTGHYAVIGRIKEVMGTRLDGYIVVGENSILTEKNMEDMLFPDDFFNFYGHIGVAGKNLGWALGWQTEKHSLRMEKYSQYHMELKLQQLAKIIREKENEYRKDNNQSRINVNGEF